MNKMLIQNYYTVRILGPQTTNVSGDYLVPTSWIKWQHEGCPTVLLVLPNEANDLKEITRKQAKRYENPNENWNLYCGEIIKSTYSYAGNDDDDLPLDLSVKSSKTNEKLTTLRTADRQGHNVNNLYGAAIDLLWNSADSTQKWTLKHQEYAPGLVELITNSRVYIGEAELRQHLRFSRKCTQLARLLIKEIFTEAAFKKCQYIGSKRGRQDLRLDGNATVTIVEFVLLHGRANNWQESTDESVRAAIKYQLDLEREKAN